MKKHIFCVDVLGYKNLKLYFQYIKRLVFTEFFKHSALLLSSNGLVQVIGFLAYPVITRLYSKEIFGEFNFFLTITGLLTIAATGKYEYAIVLPKSEKKALSLYQLCLLLTVVFVVLLCVPALFFNRAIAALIHQANLSPFLPLIPLFVLLGGFWQSTNYYFSRQKSFYNISVYNLSQNMIHLTFKIIFGLKGLLQGGLIFGTFLGQFFGLAMAFFKSKFPFRKIRTFNKARIKNTAKEYANFPKYMLLNDLLNSLAGNLPILLLSVYFDMAEIGLFSLALMVGFRPVNLFNNSMYQVLFQRIAKKIQQNLPVKAELLRFCKICAIVFLPFFTLFFFIAEYFFSLLFGTEWAEAGLYFKIMLPWLFFDILVASLGFLPDVFFRQKMVFSLNTLCLLFRLIALFAGIFVGSFKLAVLLYYGVSTIALLLMLYWYATLVQQYENRHLIHRL